MSKRKRPKRRETRFYERPDPKANAKGGHKMKLPKPGAKIVGV